MALVHVQTAATKAKNVSDEGEVITFKKGSAAVKIYSASNRGKPLFMVTWFVAGRRHRRNFADAAEARKEATLVATKLSTGEVQALLLTSADRKAIWKQNACFCPAFATSPAGFD